MINLCWNMTQIVDIHCEGTVFEPLSRGPEFLATPVTGSA